MSLDEGSCPCPSRKLYWMDSRGAALFLCMAQAPTQEASEPQLLSKKAEVPENLCCASRMWHVGIHTLFSNFGLLIG